MQKPILIVLFLMLFPVLPGPVSAEKISMAWTNNQAMLIFFEAVTKIKKHALDSPESGQVVTAAIKAYMDRHDPYGQYLTPDEYRLWKKARNVRYYGVGIELIEQEGQFFCLPRPSSPAETAGVEQGDRLLSVDGIPVHDRSIYWVGSRIRGEKGTSVSLKVDRRNMIREFNVRRTPLEDRSVWLIRSGGLDIIRINHFSERSFSETQFVLQNMKKSRHLVIDLRNNPGGDLFAAVDIAGLFLPEGSRIMTLETCQGKSVYTAKGRIWQGGHIIIWQNEFTASASEVLIAGLAAGNRTVTFGRTSYGKALTQKVMPLSDGSALVISRGRLSGPDGQTWQGKGIRPVYEIKDSAPSWEMITRQYLATERE